MPEFHSFQSLAPKNREALALCQGLVLFGLAYFNIRPSCNRIPALLSPPEDRFSKLEYILLYAGKSHEPHIGF